MRGELRRLAETGLPLRGATALGEGEAVTNIALDLGYDSPAAFTTMFRKTLGFPPSRYLKAA